MAIVSKCSARFVARGSRHRELCVVLRQEVPSGGSGLAGSRPSLIMVGVRRWSGRIAKLLLVALVAVVGLMLLYRFVDPPTTPTLAWRAVKGEPIDQRWVPIEQISPRLVQAVIASEDARFCEHWGIDFAQLRAAIEETRDGNPRGASTITMQVTKNVFLWLERSYLRKAIELPLALILDLVMPKRRIMEIYLNIAEWAPGVYGAEAPPSIISAVRQRASRRRRRHDWPLPFPRRPCATRVRRGPATSGFPSSSRHACGGASIYRAWRGEPFPIGPGMVRFGSSRPNAQPQEPTCRHARRARSPPSIIVASATSSLPC